MAKSTSGWLRIANCETREKHSTMLNRSVKRQREAILQELRSLRCKISAPRIKQLMMETRRYLTSFAASGGRRKPQFTRRNLKLTSTRIHRRMKTVKIEEKMRKKNKRMRRMKEQSQTSVRPLESSSVHASHNSDERQS